MTQREIKTNNSTIFVHIYCLRIEVLVRNNH